jgi:hypothetical protein
VIIDMMVHRLSDGLDGITDSVRNPLSSRSLILYRGKKFLKKCRRNFRPTAPVEAADFQQT